MRRISDGSEFQADRHEIANDRDPKTVFEAGTQSSPDDAERRLSSPSSNGRNSYNVPRQIHWGRAMQTAIGKHAEFEFDAAAYVQPVQSLT